MAREGDPAAIDFPRGLTARKDMERHRYDFSFSGLKTRWRAGSRPASASGEPVPVADVAASFQEAVVDVLTRKAVRACREHGVDDLLIGGGVAANRGCGRWPQERCDAAGHPAAGAAAGAVHRQRRDGGGARRADGGPGPAPSDLDLPADSSMPVTTVLA